MLFLDSSLAALALTVAAFGQTPANIPYGTPISADAAKKIGNSSRGPKSVIAETSKNLHFRPGA
jgi:hypothetical protein